MEKFIINKPIKTFCITAESFPADVMKAHQTLHAKLPPGDKRQIFGISYPDKSGGIIYKAAAEELVDGEGEKLHCETLIIRQGEYISKFITDFCDDEQSVGRAFEELLAYPQIDPNGFCLEIYEGDNGKDVKCLVPLG